MPMWEMPRLKVEMPRLEMGMLRPKMEMSRLKMEVHKASKAPELSPEVSDPHFSQPSHWCLFPLPLRVKTC